MPCKVFVLPTAGGKSPPYIISYQWCNGTPLSPLGQFRSDAQKDMITAIHKNDMPGKVLVLPTAGGKSLAYIVPCLCDPAPSITIAIIPFNAVKDEAFAKAHSAGIHTVDYKPDFDGTTTLLLVSAKHSITPEFETLIRKKAQEGIIRRFIIDEFHVVLIDGSWRRCMDEAKWFTDLDIPIFGLTGTLPLNLDTDLSRRFLVTNHNNMSVTRPAPTRGLSQNDLRTAALQKDAATCGALRKSYEMVQATQRSLQIQKQVEDALAAKNNLEQLEQFVFERTSVTATVALADFGSCAYPLK